MSPQRLTGLLASLLLAVGCQAVQYNASLSLIMWELSGIAYCSESRVLSWNCPNCEDFTKPEIQTFTVPDTHTFGFISYDSAANRIAVTFRGTDPFDIKTWLVDLNLAKLRNFDACSGCEVHEGFANDYQQAHALLYPKLQAMLHAHPSASVYVTGHSLGGALAKLCAVKLVQLGVKVVALYTFGQPRVGNAAFESFAQSLFFDSHTPVYRVTHWADPVPHLPPQLIDFTHGAQEVWYNLNSAKFTLCRTDTGEDPACSNSLLIPMEVTDHFTYLGWDFMKNFIACYRQ